MFRRGPENAKSSLFGALRTSAGLPHNFASPVFTQLVQDSVMESSMPSIMILPANIIMAVSEVEAVLSVHPLYMPQWMPLNQASD